MLQPLGLSFLSASPFGVSASLGITLHIGWSADPLHPVFAGSTGSTSRVKPRQRIFSPAGDGSFSVIFARFLALIITAERTLAGLSPGPPGTGSRPGAGLALFGVPGATAKCGTASCR